MAACGVGSRRACEELIATGRVKVNDRPVPSQGQRVFPDRDRVSLDGRLLTLEEKRTYVFYKPRNVVSTLSDPEGRPSIRDYLHRRRERLVPVGRLDFGSEGLLLLTNDGALAHRCMHPRHHVEKEYRIRLNRPLEEADRQQWLKGVESEGERLRAARVVLSRTRGSNTLSVVLLEGRNRQLRRMAEATGYEVRFLQRVRIGPVRLGRVAPGRMRLLTDEELRALSGESPVRRPRPPRPRSGGPRAAEKSPRDHRRDPPRHRRATSGTSNRRPPRSRPPASGAR